MDRSAVEIAGASEHPGATPVPTRCPECGLADARRADVRRTSGNVETTIEPNRAESPGLQRGAPSQRIDERAEGRAGDAIGRRRWIASAAVAALLVAALGLLAGADLRFGRIGAGRWTAERLEIPWSSAEIAASARAEDASATSGLYELVRARVEELTDLDPGDPRLRFDAGTIDDDDDRRAAATVAGRDRPYGLYGPSARPTRADVARLARRSDLRALEGRSDRDLVVATWIACGGVRFDDTTSVAESQSALTDAATGSDAPTARRGSEVRTDVSDADRPANTDLSRSARIQAFAAFREPITMTIVSEGLSDGSFADWGVWSGSLRAVRVRYERDGVFGPREALAVPAHLRIEPSRSDFILRAATGAAGGARYILVVSWSAVASATIAWLLATPLVALACTEFARRRSRRRRAEGRCVACGYRLDPT